MEFLLIPEELLSSGLYPIFLYLLPSNKREKSLLIAGTS